VDRCAVRVLRRVSENLSRGGCRGLRRPLPRLWMPRPRARRGRRHEYAIFEGSPDLSAHKKSGVGQPRTLAHPVTHNRPTRVGRARLTPASRSPHCPPAGSLFRFRTRTSSEATVARGRSATRRIDRLTQNKSAAGVPIADLTTHLASEKHANHCK